MIAVCKYFRWLHTREENELWKTEDTTGASTDED